MYCRIGNLVAMLLIVLVAGSVDVRAALGKEAVAAKRPQVLRFAGKVLPDGDTDKGVVADLAKTMKGATPAECASFLEAVLEAVPEDSLPQAVERISVASARVCKSDAMAKLVRRLLTAAAVSAEDDVRNVAIRSTMRGLVRSTNDNIVRSIQVTQVGIRAMVELVQTDEDVPMIAAMRSVPMGAVDVIGDADARILRLCESMAVPVIETAENNENLLTIADAISFGSVGSASQNYAKGDVAAKGVTVGFMKAATPALKGDLARAISNGAVRGTSRKNKLRDVYEEVLEGMRESGSGDYIDDAVEGGEDAIQDEVNERKEETTGPVPPIDDPPPASPF